jgi:hypothetical protein
LPENTDPYLRKQIIRQACMLVPKPAANILRLCLLPGPELPGVPAEVLMEHPYFASAGIAAHRLRLVAMDIRL